MKKIESELKELKLKIASLEKKVNDSNNNLFGKPSKELGSTSSDTTICTSGNVKVRYGSKHVTIFKDGKLVTDGEKKLIYSASQVGDKDGIWVIIPNTETESEEQVEEQTETVESEPIIPSIFLRSKGISYKLLNSDEGFLVPSGTILAFYGDVIPNGWVLCDGTKYDEEGNAVTDTDPNKKYFVVPDLQGKVLVGNYKGDKTKNFISLTTPPDVEGTTESPNIEFINYIIKL